MILLNDYLFSGDTVLKILQKYSNDLKENALSTHNSIDMVHCNFLLQQIEILEHNDFLTSQSQRIRELYKYMAKEYPFLAFTFKGRIKSLIRAEEKFNGYVVENIYDYYKESKYELLAYNKYLGSLFYFIINTNKDRKKISMNKVAIEEAKVICKENGFRNCKKKFIPFILATRLNLIGLIKYEKK